MKRPQKLFGKQVQKKCHSFLT